MRGQHHFGPMGHHHFRHGGFGGMWFLFPLLFIFPVLFLIGFIFKTGLWVPLLLIGAFMVWSKGGWGHKGWGRGWGPDWEAMKAKFRERFGDKEKWETMKEKFRQEFGDKEKWEKWGKGWWSDKDESADASAAEQEKPKRKPKNDDPEIEII